VHERGLVGREGERLAVRHLEDAGFCILEQNWRCELGEIDIVARDGDVLVVCEVKTRNSFSHGTPLEQVTRAKAGRLRRLAARWLADHPGESARDVRVDVVGVLLLSRDHAAVEHVRGID